MAETLSINGWYLAAMAATVLFNSIAPLVVWAIAQQRLRIGWRYIGYGALIFFLFQLITRVPLVQVIQSAIGPQLQASRPLLFGWLAILSLTAGLFEEIGRYVGYRWLMGREEKTWAKGVLYGLGHGGFEAMVLVGGLGLLGLINLAALSTMNLDTLPLTPEQRATVEQQIGAIAAQPAWLPFLAAWERIWSMVFHVSMSVLVLQVFLRKRLAWLGLAILAHTLFNLIAIGAPIALGLSGTQAALLPEAIITLGGLGALWLIWKLRPAALPLQESNEPGVQV